MFFWMFNSSAVQGFEIFFCNTQVLNSHDHRKGVRSKRKMTELLPNFTKAKQNALRVDPS